MNYNLEKFFSITSVYQKTLEMLDFGPKLTPQQAQSSTPPQVAIEDKVTPIISAERIIRSGYYRSASGDAAMEINLPPGTRRIESKLINFSDSDNFYKPILSFNYALTAQIYDSFTSPRPESGQSIGFNDSETYYITESGISIPTYDKLLIYLFFKIKNQSIIITSYGV